MKMKKRAFAGYGIEHQQVIFLYHTSWWADYKALDSVILLQIVIVSPGTKPPTEFCKPFPFLFLPIMETILLNCSLMP